LMEIIEEDLKKESINRDILKLVKRVDDELYVIRKLWNMLKEFAKINTIFVLLLSLSAGRVYVFSRDVIEVNPKEVKDRLLKLMRKPSTPSTWEWYGNVKYNGRNPVKVEICFYDRIEIDGEEIGVMAYGGAGDVERKRLIALSKDIQDSLKVLFRTLNLFWDHKVAAEVDSLTGLLVKKVIMSKISEYSKLAARQGVIFSLAMLDIDDFKKINDAYGHIKGDEVLKKVGKIISSAIRNTDLAGRYGGEEFLILMPATDLNTAKKAVERVLENIRSYNWREIGVERVTVSAGVAQVVPNKSVTELIEMADKALYHAKKTGKDRCVAYGGEV
ncbi:MAG: GGDEF domain-containing protein, partial [Thermotogaceae bacterium]|nr:GGDEF domain-containing protein [Thermotogaceae bacterium]